MSLEIQMGDTILISGENGAGKSTLLKTLFQGVERRELIWSSEYPGRQKVSYLGHEIGLYSSLSLYGNLKYFRGVSSHPISSERESELIHGFSLKKKLQDPIYTLSEGMKRKSGILRALIPNPLILLLDEPLNGLDSKSSDVLFGILEEQKRNSALLIVSHELEKFKRICNRHLLISSTGCNEIK